ncbi:MAG: outer membrane lipoprotein chaperone LolA [Sulfurisoma sp.]|nr:outer membrane lipoprotein chaperone LolA [Sulfurisoma sp.]
MKIPVFLSTFFTAAAISGIAHAGAVDRLKAFVEGTKSARADFSQTVSGKSGRKPQVSSGQMMFARPGKFRWVYDKPYPQLLVGDGRKLWVYDPDLKQVSVKTVGQALGSSPAALLAGDNALEKNFHLADAGNRDDLDWVEAKPKNADGGFERMRIGLAGNDLRAMEIIDNFGQTTLIRFTAFERNPQLAPELFRFVPPKGADVVGEK